MKKQSAIGAVAALALCGTVYAQNANPPAAGRGAGAAPPAAARGGAAAARGNGGGTNGVNPGIETGGAGIGSAEVAPLIFEEHWSNVPPAAQPIEQRQLSNQNLRLHLYGDVAGIRGTQHPTESYTYTGEAITNWALTLSDPNFY